MRGAFFRYLAQSTRPIFVGPWRSELGFETLYWLPWLAKWRETYKIAKDRLIVLSRGGAGAWYDAAKTVELYDYAPVAQIRQAMLKDSLQTASVKQTRITSWERTLVPLIAEGLGLRRYHVLHPSWMYHDLAPWWEEKVGRAYLKDRLTFGVVPTGIPPLEMPLPDRFLAVSFYARHTFRMDADNKAWVMDQVDKLAKVIPIVVLESGAHMDDHVAFPLSGPNIMSTAPYLTTHNNLQVQAAVLNKAIGFVGTYGGTMQLAVRLRKPAVGFYSKLEGTCYAHKALTEWLGVQQQTPVLIGRIDDAKYIREVMG